MNLYDSMSWLTPGFLSKETLLWLVFVWIITVAKGSAFWVVFSTTLPFIVTVFFALTKMFDNNKDKIIAMNLCDIDV